MASDDAVLGVERSVCGKRWRQRGAAPGADNIALAISQKHGLPDMIGRLLAARGLTADEVPSYLEPTLRELLPDPARFRDMDKAVARLVKAIEAGERITVWGDYDVDGATSAALLLRYFRSIGHPIDYYIPDRMKEGYGPNAPALLKLRGDGVSVVITVDCGITAHEPLAAAREAGLDVIVVDHHQAEPALPPAHAIVNPNRLDEEPGFGQLAAVGVTFLLLVALNRGLRASGRFGERPEPDLLTLLDIVALGTVCDVVPLTGLNRALVSQGLKVAARRQNVGLVALSDIAQMDQAPGTFHCGFLLGPRINAGGRIGRADLGARLLLEDDPVEAGRIATELDRLNRERQALEQHILAEAEAEAQAALGLEEKGSVVVTAADGWHPGVVGIVAARLKERFGRPAFAVALEPGGSGTGSGRSIAGVDLGRAVRDAVEEGLLIKGGGHAMAAGITVARERLAAFRAFLEERLRPEVEAARRDDALRIDGALSAAAANVELVRTVARAGPFGAGNAEPVFAIPAPSIAYADPVGQGHVRVRLKSGDGALLNGIAFRAADKPLGRALLEARGQNLHVAGTISIDRWQGAERVQLRLLDAAPVAPASGLR